MNSQGNKLNLKELRSSGMFESKNQTKMSDLFAFKKKSHIGLGCSSVVEHLPSMCQALALIPELCKTSYM
jgi:hypothetical protein